MTLVDVVGYLGMVLAIIASSLSTMIPLRMFGLAANFAFLIYGVLTMSFPIIIQSSVLMPLHGYRLYQMIMLIRRSEQASKSDLSMDWLRPFGKTMRCAKGDIVFNAGDEANEMYYIESGRFQLTSGVELGPNELVGEIGLLAPGEKRTQGMACAEDGALLKVSYRDLKQLYFQNPEFGFYLLRLVGRRLLENVDQATGAK
ncbi:cyclic nucleotide-binding domain-containing protein [Hoeflea sp. AS60]|uniref:Crp/Fnr family transcriptional regulator n=1 Tax=Hoeflea sp. AS60 TaxID=3135780 RepID=UPI003179F1F2